MATYTQAELDYAVGVANRVGFKEGYELGRGHLQAIKDAVIEIPF